MEKTSVYKVAANLYKLLTIYFIDYRYITNQKKKRNKKYDLNKLFLEGFKYTALNKKDEEI